MKNGWPTRIFIAFGIFLWAPISIGIFVMVDLHPLLAVISAICIGIASVSVFLSAVIRKII